MWLMIVQVIFSLLILALSADRFVSGAVAISTRMHWSPLLVGTVLVGFATTFPEMLVSFVALTHHHVGLSLGNALGSYIANIGMVLGCTACVRELRINAELFRRELPILTMTLLLAVLLLLDQFLGRLDGVILLLTLTGLLIWIIRSMRRETASSVYADLKVSERTHQPFWRSMGLTVLSLIGLLISAHFLVDAASDIAHFLGVSDLVIGLTIVAVGTSLPELVTSLMCLRHGQDDMAVGNIIGSNIFGILGVVAIPALLAPGQIDSNILWRDCTAMILITLALWVFIYNGMPRQAVIKRWEGMCLLLLFLGYMFVVAMGDITLHHG